MDPGLAQAAQAVTQALKPEDLTGAAFPNLTNIANFEALLDLGETVATAVRDAIPSHAETSP
jgi:hypothetical protein